MAFSNVQVMLFSLAALEISLNLPLIEVKQKQKQKNELGQDATSHTQAVSPMIEPIQSGPCGNYPVLGRCLGDSDVSYFFLLYCIT